MLNSNQDDWSISSIKGLKLAIKRYNDAVQNEILALAINSKSQPDWSIFKEAKSVNKFK